MFNDTIFRPVDGDVEFDGFDGLSFLDVDQPSAAALVQWLSSAFATALDTAFLVIPSGKFVIEWLRVSGESLVSPDVDPDITDAMFQLCLQALEAIADPNVSAEQVRSLFVQSHAATSEWMRLVDIL